MAVDDQTRLNLHRKLEEVLGAEEANTLMAHLPPVSWNDVATKTDTRSLRDELHAVDSVIRSDMRAGFADLRGSLHREITKVRTEIAGLRGSMHSEIAGLRGSMHSEIAGLRGDIHKAANDQTKWMVGFICGWSAIMLASARLLL